MPFPFQIFQTPERVNIAFEYALGIRVIHTNGTPHPKGPINWWVGDSRGRWEDDTLVVDVVHFTEQTWFDRAGNFHSDALHLVERYTLEGPDHMRYGRHNRRLQGVHAAVEDEHAVLPAEGNTRAAAGLRAVAA
jgi:hypothetical protein